MRGRIDRRLLISTLADPDEVACRLPPTLRPHVIDGGTVIGCCLLELSDVRPDPLPAFVGRSLRAAAHRISVEWDTPDGVEVGVFVPIRLTDSHLAAAVGGRFVPGVHRRVRYDTRCEGHRLAHVVDAEEAPFHLEVDVRRTGEIADAAVCDLMTSTCLGARIGLSPARRGGFDAIRMDLSHHLVEEVEVDRLVSPFLSSFVSADPPTGRLLSDASVRWSPATGPLGASVGLRGGEQQPGELARHGRESGSVGVELGLEHDAVGQREHE